MITSQMPPEPLEPGSARSKVIISELQPTHVGLATATPLPDNARSIASIAIAMGWSRGITWSTGDDVLDRVLIRLKKDWESRW